MNFTANIFTVILFFQENCQQITDKYIEYEPVIIMIDLILLKKEAFRHFLFNTQFQVKKNLEQVTFVVAFFLLILIFSLDFLEISRFITINGSLFRMDV